MILTIGRQFGSSGSEIGRKIAEQTGMPYYDKNMIDQVAEKLGFSPQYVRQVEEKPTGSFLFSMAMYSYTPSVHDGMLPAELKISSAQAEFIQEKAAEGSGIFVGRCADYILKDRKDMLSVFIYADMKTRVKNVMERYHLEERNAVRTITQTDKKRAMYYNTNTQHHWGAKESYNLMIDSGILGVDGTVELLKYYMKLFENR